MWSPLLLPTLSLFSIPVTVLFFNFKILFLLKKVFTYFLLHCVFVAARRLSLPAVHGLLIAVTSLVAERWL